MLSKRVDFQSSVLSKLASCSRDPEEEPKGRPGVPGKLGRAGMTAKSSFELRKSHKEGQEFQGAQEEPKGKTL